MNRVETGQPSVLNPWFFMSAIQRIGSSFYRLFDGFFKRPEFYYPPNESGELMQHFMSHKSWFDNISSRWYGMTTFSQIAYVAGFILLSSVAGLVIGAPVLMALSSAFFSFMSHLLLVSHEENRRQAATVFAQEPIALSAALKKTHGFFEEATAGLITVMHELKMQSDEMQAQVKVMDTEGKGISQQNDTLITIVDTVKTETDRLMEQEKMVTSEFKVVFDDLKKCDGAITTSVARVVAMGDTVSQFSEAVEGIQISQKTLSQAANRFFLSVSERPPLKTPDEDVHHRTFLKETDKQIDEDEAFIAAWKASH